MVVGVPKEIKEDEYRVAITPAGVMQLRQGGHTVLIEEDAGMGTWIRNESYQAAGAEICSQEEVWRRSELIVKVKEPQKEEYTLIQPGQILFTYFHFAASADLMHAMVKSGSVCIAYETVQNPDGSLPLLTPMSEVAGRISIQQGAKFLEKPMGGRGVLLCGIPGVKPATVAIIGGGIVGLNAAKVAAGYSSLVYILDVNLDRLRYLGHIFPENVVTLHSNPETIQQVVSESDLVIGAVYVTGTKTPILVTKEMLTYMKPGSVVVDVCVDQGGCFETTLPTSHRKPTYILHNVVHYAVTNMPGAVANTSTYGLTNATLPYVSHLANRGLKALNEDLSLRAGLSVAEGEVVQKPIADQFGYDCLGAADYVKKYLEKSVS